MLIFIENTPRAYAWGSRDALPDLLGCAPTGEPQAELWLGTHPGSPAHVARPSVELRTLIDLVESDPERYGVDGGPLPFLLKVLAIGAPLSLQVHPDREQAASGFAAEDAAGVPRDAPHRNYGDPNHKPELLVALSEVAALSGFRPLEAAHDEVHALAAVARACGAGDAGDDGAGGSGCGEAAETLEQLAMRLRGADPDALRREFLEWAFSGDRLVEQALAALGAVVGALADPPPSDDGAPDAERARARKAVRDAAVDIAPERRDALVSLLAAHPGDPGVLVSLLLHLVRLAPGEAIYLRARQLHAYLSGIAVEVMAASDNVLRAGLTAKHVDIAELCRIVDTGELADPRFHGARVARGLIAWRPDVPDFALLRARVHDPEEDEGVGGGRGPHAESADSVEVPTAHPVVLMVTAGRVRIERLADAGAGADGGLAEVAAARKGQSLYVSAGEPIRITGHGEVFIATVP